MISLNLENWAYWYCFQNVLDIMSAIRLKDVGRENHKV